MRRHDYRSKNNNLPWKLIFPSLFASTCLYIALMSVSLSVWPILWKAVRSSERVMQPSPSTSSSSKTAFNDSDSGFACAIVRNSAINSHRFIYATTSFCFIFTTWKLSTVRLSWTGGKIRRRSDTIPGFPSIYHTNLNKWIKSPKNIEMLSSHVYLVIVFSVIQLHKCIRITFERHIS